MQILSICCFDSFKSGFKTKSSSWAQNIRSRAERVVNDASHQSTALWVTVQTSLLGDEGWNQLLIKHWKHLMSGSLTITHQMREKRMKGSFTYYWHDCEDVVLQVASVMSHHLGIGRHHQLHESRIRQKTLPAGTRAVFGTSRMPVHRFLYRHHFLFQSSVAVETDVIIVGMIWGKKQVFMNTFTVLQQKLL